MANTSVDTHIRFVCAECGLPITLPQIELPDEALLVDDDEVAHIARGHFILSTGDHLSVTKGEYLANVDDLINTAPHSDSSLWLGCCGPSSFGSLNTVCLNGHEVGTEIADCYTPRVMTLDPLRCVKVAGSSN